ncbi:hypothetical protein CRG86_009150 [Photobacterium leiognathi]|nr:hypothetical protein CRG86_009150 [Photobacterium leiognathi]
MGGLLNSEQQATILVPVRSRGFQQEVKTGIEQDYATYNVWCSSNVAIADGESFDERQIIDKLSDLLCSGSYRND